MNWFIHLWTTESVASSILILAAVSVIGLAIGSIGTRGVRLGVAGALFAGIAAGHFGLRVQHDILHFARELGLILFVYAVGVTVGPGFFSSLRSGGLRLNIVAATVVISGALLTAALVRLAGIPTPIATGMFSGATTNTPSLAAATQTLAEHPASLRNALAALRQADPGKATSLGDTASMPDSVKSSLVSGASRMPGLGYAVAYPFGVVGILLSMLGLRIALGAKARREAQEEVVQRAAPLVTENFEVTNPAIAGRLLGDIALLERLDLVVSRVGRAGSVQVADNAFELSLGDVLLAVGTREAMRELRSLLGDTSTIDLRDEEHAIDARWIVVSERRAVGRRVRELRLAHETGTRLTRVRRGDVELHPSPELRLHFGDSLRVVGTVEGLGKARTMLGDSKASLHHPDIAAVFLGITLGVILGSIPLSIPGIPIPLKLGLAGGPLLVAILLSRLQRVGSVLTTLPVAANAALKDLGIALFLAAVGLESGESFANTLLHGQGLSWMLWAATITLLPLLLGVILARLVLKTSFPAILGTMAGSMTDPPALAFSASLASPQATGVAYATVYPLTMLLRIVAAQVLVLALAS